MNILQYLPQGAVLLSIQLLITAPVFGCHLPRRERFPLRLCLGTAAYLILSVLAAKLLDLSVFGAVLPTIIYTFFVLLSSFIFKLDGKTVWFFFLSTIATQHLAVATADSIQYALGLRENPALELVSRLAVFVAVLSLIYFLYGKKMNNVQLVKTSPWKLVAISAIIFVVVYVVRYFTVTYMAELPSSVPLYVTMNIYSALGSFMCLFALYSSNSEAVLIEENRLIEQLLRERKAQLKFSKETVDLINIKCHDMRHQIKLLEGNAALSMDQGTLDELKKTATMYGAFAQTGNEALDTILTEKGVYCEGQDISLTYMVDGACVSMLETADLCALFGNILENAIEAEQNQEKGKRMITLQVFRKRNYLCIHAENYCEILPELQEGIPVTSKSDKNNHGFGMKSILYTVHKYGGNMSIVARDHMFCIDILIPAEEEAI